MPKGCIDEQGPLRGHDKPYDTSLLWASTRFKLQARLDSAVGVLALAAMPGLQDTLHSQCCTVEEEHDMQPASQPRPQLVISSTGVRARAVQACADGSGSRAAYLRARNPHRRSICCCPGGRLRSCACTLG